ncbi:MAG: branched-chain amino acid ABC transporter permease [Deltaproteobacteria bacterium]|nr:branched-chain amino acid ABC transporter permease [Deltaproteobacteria bacterium]
MESISDLYTPISAGILLGGLYALVALGFSLVFGVMKIINVAHGDLVILGSYLAFAALSVLDLDPFLSLFIIIPAMLILGFLLQKYFLNRAMAVSMDAPVIICIGISLILENIFQIIWSPLSRGLTTSYSLQSYNIGRVSIPLVYLLDLVMALIVMLVLREFLRRTYLGRAIIAASQDKRAAQLMGIDTNQVYAYAFAIAMACAAIAGILIGLTFPFTPTSGVPILIIAFGVVILGGLGSMVGTLIGGIIFGLAQTLGGFFFGVAAQMFVAYVMVLVILGIRPQGIFGR